MRVRRILHEFFVIAHPTGQTPSYDDTGIMTSDGGGYFSKLERGWMQQQSFRLSIEDPADPSCV